MTIQDRPWYTVIPSSVISAKRLHFTERELDAGLRKHGYIRRDLPSGHRIDLRWAEDGLGEHGQPFDGQIWRDGALVCTGGAESAAMVLGGLRASSTLLEPPVEW